jgi:hypothetical protein
MVAGEDEAKIPRTLRERDDLVPKRNTDPDILDGCNLLGVLLPCDLSEDAGVGNGNHHDAGSEFLPFYSLGTQAEGMSQDQLFQR